MAHVQPLSNCGNVRMLTHSWQCSRVAELTRGSDTFYGDRIGFRSPLGIELEVCLPFFGKNFQFAFAWFPGVVEHPSIRVCLGLFRNGRDSTC